MSSLTKEEANNPVFDDQALEEMGKKLRELMDARAHAEENGFKEEYDRLTVQIDELTKQIQAAMARNGKQKDLNSLFNKLRPRIANTIKLAIKKMRGGEPPMPKLADHFVAAISCEAPLYVYRSLGIKWNA